MTGSQRVLRTITRGGTRWHDLTDSLDFLFISLVAVMRNLEPVSFSNRLHRIGYLLKHTFTVVGRDADIIRPWVWMNVYALAMVTLFFTGLAGSFAGATGVAAAGIGLAVVMFVYKYFFYNYREVSQSWLVYETICGRARSYAEAKQTARECQAMVRKLAGLDILMAYLMSRRSNESKGWTSWLINLFLSGLEEVWDLVNHYMLPAVAIDRLTLTEGVESMKSLRNQVPETLAGVFGIDFIGRVVGQVTGTLYFLLILLSGGVAYLGAGVLPDAFAFTVEENPLGSEPLVLNVLPLLLGVYVAKGTGIVFERTITSIKVIYFTIFYTQITHRERIADDLQPQLVRYLRMEEVPVEETASAMQGAASSG